MKFTGKNFIAGEWASGDPEKGFHAVNPAGGETLEPEYLEATAEQIDEAVTKAREAYYELRSLTPERKASFLEILADNLELHFHGIVERAGLESGLSEQRLQFEFVRTLDQPRRFAKLLREGSWVNARIDRGDSNRKPRPKPDMRTMLQPLGPVAVFGASNFPIAISVLGTDTISAFAAGCPVIVKAHPAQPGTCELTAIALQEAINEFSLPDGTFSLLHGAGIEVGEQLVKHPQLSAVAFTGSLPGGRSLMNLAASRPVPIPVFAEMGSLNPVFLLPDALKQRKEVIAKGLVQSLTLDAGQFCTNPGILLALEGPDLDRFLQHLSQEIAEVAPQTMLHAGIYKNYQTRVQAIQGVEGVSCAATSKPETEEQQLHAGANLFVTDYNTWKQSPELQEECFGPSTILIKARNLEELQDFARNMQGSLTATLQGTEKDFADHQSLQQLLETHVGRLVFNGFPTGVEIGNATHHGGPYPATSTAVHTSIGLAAIERFVRPVCYQNCPDAQLPEELKNANPRKLLRTIDGHLTQDSIEG